MDESQTRTTRDKKEVPKEQTYLGCCGWRCGVYSTRPAKSPKGAARGLQVWVLLVVTTLPVDLDGCRKCKHEPTRHSLPLHDSNWLARPSEQHVLLPCSPDFSLCNQPNLRHLFWVPGASNKLRHFLTGYLLTLDKATREKKQGCCFNLALRLSQHLLRASSCRRHKLPNGLGRHFHDGRFICASWCYLHYLQDLVG